MLPSLTNISDFLKKNVSFTDMNVKIMTFFIQINKDCEK